MANFLPVQIQYATLAGSGAALGATSIVLTSFKDIDSVNLTMASFGSIGYGTLEPNNSSQEEQISFTGITQNSNGTATLTGVKTVLFISPFTETSGTAKSHPGGVKFVISNTAGFYKQYAIKTNTETITGLWTFDTGKTPRITTLPSVNTDAANKAYVDSVVTGGAADMNLTTKGLGEEATAAEINAGTQAGGTSAQLVVNPKYLKDSTYYTQLPTSDEKDALDGTGTPSAANKYVTSDDVSDAGVTGKIVRATGTALPALSGINLVSTNIAGLYITGQTAGDLIVKNSGDGWTRVAKGTAGHVLTVTTATPGLAYQNIGIRWVYLGTVSGDDGATIAVPAGSLVAIIVLTIFSTSNLMGEVTIFKVGKSVGRIAGDNTNNVLVAGQASWSGDTITITKTTATAVNADAYFYK